ncbi:hypothetical protein J437_LFUL002409 [Ladona fulva]|uniref:DNA-directed DNA polymerase n=1 Tax=Ladona fulva TaxID=123851 RepID=A0A8K0K597_LADFU|nr:hypothetical protein J437_LFUL002409 [Ladona fulva]
MWECTFDRMVKENVILSNFINSNPLSMESPINPRDAFLRMINPRVHSCVPGVNLALNSRGVNVNTFNKSERFLTGTWVTEEVKVEVREGYEVIKMHEAWHYDRTTEASGFPYWCRTPDDKSKYLSSFRERENIALDETSVQQNPGLRQLSKLMLNSFWGRFGMRENLLHCSILRHEDQLLDLATNSSVELMKVVPINEDSVYACRREREESLRSHPSTNVLIAAYTTCHARLILYNYFRRLDQRVLYFDTDSVIFAEWPGEFSPSVGDYLGDMTDEVEKYGEGCYISEFVSGEPKNYALKICSKTTDFCKTVCKVHRITINSSNAEDVSFDRLKAMVLGDSLPLTVKYEKRIARVAPYNLQLRLEG